MLIPFSTTQAGQIHSLTLYKYAFTQKCLGDAVMKKSFIRQLKSEQDQFIFEITGKYFTLFMPLGKMASDEYQRVKKITIDPPFENTPRISNFLGNIVRNEFSKSYKRFLNNNIFGTSFYNYDLFRLIKGFEFSIEVFNNGFFYLHLQPTSKIVSSKLIDNSYIFTLLNASKNGAFDNFKISLVNASTYKSSRFDLSSKHDLDKAKELIDSNQKYVATFDYHFLANHSPSIFAQVSNLSEKDLNQSITLLNQVISKLNYPTWITTEKKNFTRFDVTNIGNNKNLLIGDNLVVKEQKAAFYSGVYSPISDKIIIPLLNENFGNISLFYDLFTAFNKNGKDIEILEPLNINFEDEEFLKKLKSIRNKYRLRGKPNKKILLVIFTKNMMIKEDLYKLQELGFLFQLYLGNIDKFQLSNFTVKCIEKLGGILSIIKTTQEPKSTYFIGIDMGHSTHQKDKSFTNLGIVLFDNQGVFLKKSINSNINRNEAITKEAIEAPLKVLLSYIKDSNRELPKKVIIHRDGKLHKMDTDNLLLKVSELFDIHEIDIVEIIKSGYPVLAKYNTETKIYSNLESGDCWVNYEQRYAIMVTNIQADSKSAVLNPIIIKHKVGATDFAAILKQVYWFTKIYTNNLYTSTRLPATTLKANNIVSTSDKLHVSSNLG